MRESYRVEPLEECKENLLEVIQQRIYRAKLKHPTFAKDLDHALRVMKSEMMEWEAESILVCEPGYAVNQERYNRMVEEAIDILVVVSRFLTEIPGAKYHIQELNHDTRRESQS